ncbi:hypothetical protein AB204_00500 [Xenorhabdus khoisanae]|uniref:Uncharacterized protein n=1 Tax=Xenorhabdus khoisanae TaxID=880157 RepID=A0A0J5IV48_9GAMM|nr:hypothetical protein AB204_00500 [Xenorhabdus khoisanae]
MKEKYHEPPAGQAEILFPSRATFKVHAIKRDGKNTYVLLSDISSDANIDTDIKDIFSGKKI